MKNKTRQAPRIADLPNNTQPVLTKNLKPEGKIPSMCKLLPRNLTSIVLLFISISFKLIPTYSVLQQLTLKDYL